MPPVGHRGADVVDQPLGDQLLTVPDAVEHLTTAIGVVVCCRMSRNADWSSAGVGSSIQNIRYGSSEAPSRLASIGDSR